MATITKIHPRPHYRIDNILIDEYGEKIGAIGVAIYNVLSRHADRQTGICYPCIGTIAQKLKLGRTTVKKYLRILLNHYLIAIAPRRSEAGDPTSNSYMILDPSPEKVALRRRQLEALLTPQHGTFTLGGGRSFDDPPPCPAATDPQSPADPKQSSSPNKKIRTIAEVDLMPTEKQKTCQHPPSEIAHLSDNITICNHCFALLPEHLTLAGNNATTISPETALPECDPACGGTEGEATTGRENLSVDRQDHVSSGMETALKMARESHQMPPQEGKAAKKTNSLVALGKLITGRLKSA